MGFLGSIAYFTALYFKFVGINDDYREIILEPFLRNKYSSSISKRKVLWYSSIGGFIACVFQANVPTFVAIQSFIIGATWPGVVSQFLSGRMESPTHDEQNKKDLAKKMEENEREADVDSIANLMKKIAEK